MRKNNSEHLERFKSHLHQNVIRAYGFNPFVEVRNREFVKIRHCIAYVLYSYETDEKKKFSLVDIGYIIGYKNKSVHHATVLHAIKKVEQEKPHYNDIKQFLKQSKDIISVTISGEDLLSDIYKIVGQSLSERDKKLNDAMKVMFKVDDSLKLKEDEWQTWNIMKQVIIQNI